MNPLPKYHELLNEAHSASDEVDMFDVCSSDPDSLARFRELVLADAMAQDRLIAYVARNHEELIEALRWLEAQYGS